MARQHAAHDAFPLRTVTVMTGLTPHLIRVCEKRATRSVAPIRGAPAVSPAGRGPKQARMRQVVALRR